jgi:hypothetical protein
MMASANFWHSDLESAKPPRTLRPCPACSLPPRPWWPHGRRRSLPPPCPAAIWVAWAVWASSPVAFSCFRVCEPRLRARLFSKVPARELRKARSPARDRQGPRSWDQTTRRFAYFVHEGEVACTGRHDGTDRTPRLGALIRAWRAASRVRATDCGLLRTRPRSRRAPPRAASRRWPAP